MFKKYFVLFVKFEHDDDWSVEFGDYDRSVVVQEVEDSFMDCYNTKIDMLSDDKQSTIDERLGKLNNMA